LCIFREVVPDGVERDHVEVVFQLLRSAFVINTPVGLMVLLLPLLAAQDYQKQRR
jgi:hypothetical protein